MFSIRRDWLTLRAEKSSLSALVCSPWYWLLLEPLIPFTAMLAVRVPVRSFTKDLVIVWGRIDPPSIARLAGSVVVLNSRGIVLLYEVLSGDKGRNTEPVPHRRVAACLLSILVFSRRSPCVVTKSQELLYTRSRGECITLVLLCALRGLCWHDPAEQFAITHYARLEERNDL